MRHGERELVHVLDPRGPVIVRHRASLGGAARFSTDVALALGGDWRARRVRTTVEVPPPVAGPREETP
ncbi:hypothetical protein GCM10017788_57060 [Amycolatopsis acidiphila]|nr:hypothetical protein GCM10017788_57060 [Amycolatopsis acidiphila]